MEARLQRPEREAYKYRKGTEVVKEWTSVRGSCGLAGVFVCVDGCLFVYSCRWDRDPQPGEEKVEDGKGGVLE